MSLLSPFLEAEHHREAATALLRHLIPHGDRGTFARRVGVSPQHLSQILAVDSSPHHMPERRNPSSELISRMVKAVSAPIDVRESLRTHLEAARQSLESSRRRVLSTDEPVDRIVLQVRRAHHLATFAPDGATARRLYRTVVTMGRELIEQIDGEAYPLDIVEIYLCLHDVLCVLDDSASALYYAMLACDYVEMAADRPDCRRHDRIGDLTVNAARAVGVAYCNLGRLKEAQLSFRKANDLPFARDQAAQWAPHFSRDRLTVLYKAPWLTLKAADALVREAETSAHDQMPDVFRLLMYIKRADCFIAYGSVQEGQRQLERLPSPLGNKENVGPLHRSIYLTSFLKLCARTGDASGATYWGSQAVRIAADAGLVRQMRSVIRLMRQAGVQSIGQEGPEMHKAPSSECVMETHSISNSPLSHQREHKRSSR